MSMHDVGLQVRDQVHEARPYQEVGGVRLTVDCQAPHAELQPWRNLGECCAGAFAAGQAVGDDADMVASVDLSIGKIEDVAEDSTDGRAHRVDNAKWPLWCLGHASEPAFADEDVI